MRIKATDRAALEAALGGDRLVNDYARLYPMVLERSLSLVTSVAQDYEKLGLALVIETRESERERAGRIAAAFGLTPSEAALAAFIGAGGSVADFAAARQVSRNTARNQLRQVFDKTGVHRQSELVRLLRDF